MNIDIKDIIHRNIAILKYVIETYELRISLKDLDGYESIYITYSKEENNIGFRVMAKKYVLGKQYNVNLYNFLKRKIANSSREQVIATREDFMKFECAWKELRAINELTQLEEEFYAIDGSLTK